MKKRILNKKQLELFREWANKNQGGYREYIKEMSVTKYGKQN